MKANLTLLLLFSFAINFTFAKSQPFVLTGDSEDVTIPNQFLSIYADTENREIDEILANENVLFQIGNKDNVFINSRENTYWITFDLKNESTKVDNWYLEIPNWGMSNVDVYIENNKKEFNHFKVGSANKATQKEVEHKNYLFNLPELNSKKRVYLKIQSEYPTPLQFWVRSNNLMINYSNKEYGLLGIFYGILGSLAIFNLLLFAVQRKFVNLFYVLYIVTCMIFCTSEDGLGFQYIWPEYPQLNAFFYNYNALIYTIAFFLYIVSFLNLHKTQPRLFKATLFGSLSIIIYSHLIAAPGTFQTLGTFIPVILLFIVAAIRSKKDESVPTFWLLTALVISLIGSSILLLRNKGYIDFGSLSRIQLILIIYAMNIAFVFEAILFAIAIVKRIKLDDTISKNAISYNEKRFRKIFESSFDASILYSASQGKIVDVNNKACTLFDKSKSALIESNILDIINLNEKDKVEYKNILTQPENEMSDNLIYFETTGIKSKSQLFDCEISFSPIEHVEEKFVIINIKDVTVKKISERKLADQMKTIQENNIQLEQYINSNSELESFAYIASHDIKQPLRTIKSFSKVLQQHLTKKDMIDENSTQYLEFIQSSVINLEKLTSDILEHSRMSSEKNSVYKNEDINDILSITQQNLNQLIFENNVQFQIKNLPKEFVVAKMKMIQLFQNIISNAIKFRKKNNDCIIKVTGIEEPDFWRFEIQDNGIGIEKEHFDKIFQVFSKIHNAADYKGSGIGLATCKKIVDLHEGRIWVSSEFGIGTTFHFTIAKDISLANPELVSEDLEFVGVG